MRLVPALPRVLLPSRHAAAADQLLGAVVVRCRLDVAVPVLVVLSFGAMAMVRVAAGQCPAGTSMFAARMCNPYADASGVPPEDSIFLFFTPILTQLVVRSVPARVLVFLWVLVLTFVGCTVGYANAVHHVWVSVCSVFFITVSFELQRLQRVAFRLGEQAVQARHQVRWIYLCGITSVRGRGRADARSETARQRSPSPSL